jgi:hypothetical protein
MRAAATCAWIIDLQNMKWANFSNFWREKKFSLPFQIDSFINPEKTGEKLFLSFLSFFLSPE